MSSTDWRHPAADWLEGRARKLEGTFAGGLLEELVSDLRAEACVVAPDLSALTERQREVYDIIARELRAARPAPSIRELADELGVTSTNAVNDHLKALVRKGVIKRDRLKSRAIQLVGGQA